MDRREGEEERTGAEGTEGICTLRRVLCGRDYGRLGGTEEQV